MNEIEMNSPKAKSRRKILARIGLLSLFPFLKLGLFSKKNPVISCAPPPGDGKKETMKVLSQDGKLLEVDVSKVKRIEGKISDEELRKWIKV
jgi:hypothetical protein